MDSLFHMKGYAKAAFCWQPTGGWVKRGQRAPAEGQDPPESKGLICTFQKEPVNKFNLKLSFGH